MSDETTSFLGDVFTSSREKGKADLPLLSVTLNNGLVVRDSLDRRTETNLRADEHLLVKQGDIAYNMMRVWQGALGRAAFDGLVSPAYVVLRPSKSIDSLYAEYFFKTPRMIYLFWAYSYGLTKDRLRLYYKDFARISVYLPLLSEQKKVAKTLSVWDRAIQMTKGLIATNQQQKEGLMQQLMMGEEGLFGACGEFKCFQFSSVFNIDSKSLGKTTPDGFDFYYISLSDVEKGRISSKLKRYQYKGSPSRARRILTEGDILLTTVRPNLQGFAKVNAAHSDCIASTGFSVLTPKDHVCGDYIYHYLFSSHITSQINALTVGTNYPAINSSDISGLAFYCPSYVEQKKIARIFNNCDYTISVLQQKLIRLKKEKKALMQQLLTGKRRVKLDPPEKTVSIC